MRLGGGIAQIGGAVGGHRCHQGVFRGRYAGFIQEDVGALEAPGAEFQPVLGGDRGAELLESEIVRIKTPPADDVAARRRQHYLAAAGKQRPYQQDRGADPRAKLRI